MLEIYFKGRIIKVLMSVMLIIDVLFKCVVIDLVGLIELRIKNGNCYILSFVDFVMCYLEVVVFKGIEIE